MTQADAPARAAGRGARDALTGTRIRERRTVLGIRQAELARQVQISPSYLNLIEHNRRRIGGKLLVDLAGALGVEVSALIHGAEVELLDQLSEAATRAPEIAAETDRLDEFVGRFPGWARLITIQGREIDRLHRQVDALADRLSHDPALSGVLHDLLSKVTAIQSTAAILAETGDLERDWQDRFIANLSADSRDLAARSEALVGYLDGSAETRLDLASPQEELESYLARTGFHIAPLEAPEADIDAVLEAAAPYFASQGGRDLARKHFDRYRADAGRIPLTGLRDQIARIGPDPLRIADAFAVDPATAMRRIASLPGAPGTTGAGLVLCDAAGALLLRKPTEGFLLPRFGAGCALWPLYTALGQAGRPVRARLAQAGSTDLACMAYAVCMPVPPFSDPGRQAMEASMLIVPRAMFAPHETDAIDPVSVGASCRTCPIEACGARREQSVLKGLF